MKYGVKKVLSTTTIMSFLTERTISTIFRMSKTRNKGFEIDSNQTSDVFGLMHDFTKFKSEKSTNVVSTPNVFAELLFKLKKMFLKIFLIQH